jgi:hypothetical protein
MLAFALTLIDLGRPADVASATTIIASLAARIDDAA